MISKEEKIKKIRELVYKNNISKYKIAKHISASEPTIARILSGETKNPSIRIVDEIYNLLTNESSEENIIQGIGSSIKVERIVDLLFENIAKFENNERFSNYILNKNKDAIIKYQEELLIKSKNNSS